MAHCTHGERIHPRVATIGTERVTHSLLGFRLP
jgi:hypothetical protein